MPTQFAKFQTYKEAIESDASYYNDSRHGVGGGGGGKLLPNLSENEGSKISRNSKATS